MKLSTKIALIVLITVLTVLGVQSLSATSDAVSVMYMSIGGLR